ncbi:Rieske (2Fe-2S) protein [Paenibacillus spongiae]|uniref:Rieske 2Fe-2S domain-containing protein n=1 Tax=Paenibacillus spongiae TaxID=2909671 RepID=A0ABY5S472_9BACL|nr:Rieske 2Fe-2S domain-containing protein [Paenibacillus spongiae]UVI27528.1 Rieske 2Fe-2S domain-containing protein [Paenibacillus spongiae]
MNERLDWIQACKLEDLQEKGVIVAKGAIAVFYYEGRVHAVDNRCPHLGFPLHKGSLCEGILTCHWHHARFDICSGGTLDPWADDVPSHEVMVDNETVWVNPKPSNGGGVQSLIDRLKAGLEQNIGIVIAKAVVGLIEAGVPESEIARIGILFGTRNGPGWHSGLTILTAMARVVPKLDKAGKILALYQGLVHVARNSAGREARHLLGELPSVGVPAERLAQWYRNCIEVRDTQGAEKVLLTAVHQGSSMEQLANMMLVAATDHFYLDGGHVFDFHNKAFEAVELVGEEHTKDVLASLVPMMGRASRSEEQHQWQSPINLVKPIEQALEELAKGLPPEHTEPASEEDVLRQLLSDEPLQTISMMKNLLLGGMPPSQLAQLIALAAADRIVRFHVQNDFGDWIAVLHTFTYAHAVHQRLDQSAEPLLNRALFHGAMRIYLDRFLNVPAAARPKQLSAAPSMDTEELLPLLDQRQQVAPAAQWVCEYVNRGGSVDVLWNTLGHILLREDADFHTFQLYEASVMEYEEWNSRDDAFAVSAKETLLLACTRYLAAHAPTARELPHTARIAWRLHRGERLFEE